MASLAQVPLSALHARVDAGRRGSDAFQAYCKGRFEVENTMGSGLKRRVWPKAVVESELPASSVRAALEALEAFTECMSQEHFALAQSLEHRVRGPLQFAALAVQEVSARARHAVAMACQQHQQSEENLRRSKRAHARATRDAEQQRARLHRTIHDSVANKEDIAVAADRVERADAAVRDHEADVGQRRQELLRAFAQRDTAVAEATAELGRLEKERLERVLTSVRAVVQIEKQYLAARTLHVERLERVLERASADGDMAQFVRLAQAPDHTLAFGRALVLLDWDWQRVSARARPSDPHAGGVATSPSPQPSPAPDSPSRPASASRRAANNPFASPAPPPRAPPQHTASEPGAAEKPGQGGGEESEGVDSARGRAERQLAGLLTGEAEKGMEGSEEEGTDSLLLARCSDLHAVLLTTKGREWFLQVLNANRGVAGCKALPPLCFAALTQAVVVFLDGCLEHNEVAHAKSVGMMANTFHTTRPVPDGAGDGEGGGDVGKREDGGGGGRLYVLERIQAHAMWRREGFWEQSLLASVAQQFDLCPQRVRWDDLSPDQLRSEVVRVHNTVFSQLTTVAFNMLELGLDPGVTSSFLCLMCDEYQLSSGQKADLFRSLEHRGVHAPTTVLTPHPPNEPPPPPHAAAPIRKGKSRVLAPQGEGEREGEREGGGGNEGVGEMAEDVGGEDSDNNDGNNESNRGVLKEESDVESSPVLVELEVDEGGGDAAP